MVEVTADPTLLERPIEVRSGVSGIERPLALLDAVRENAEPLLNLANRHVVSARQFDRETLVQLSRLAADMERQPTLLHQPLSGKIMITAFYEPSTRTRLSFESAWHRLGGDVISITDPLTTGIAKGESLRDVAEMFSSYGDLVVLRAAMTIMERDGVYDLTALKRLRARAMRDRVPLEDAAARMLAETGPAAAGGRR